MSALRALSWIEPHEVRALTDPANIVLARWAKKRNFKKRERGTESPKHFANRRHLDWQCDVLVLANLVSAAVPHSRIGLGKRGYFESL